MGYAAFAFAILRFALGMRVRMKVLLPILLLLLLASVVLSIARGLFVADAVVTVVLAQAIVQWAYFFGLVVRGLFVVFSPPTALPRKQSPSPEPDGMDSIVR
jgi:hypothetical protein